MADGLSTGDAATELWDSDSRITRERHKRQDVISTTTTSTGTVQDNARRVHDEITVLENHPNLRQQHQHRSSRRNCYPYVNPSSRRNIVNGNGIVDNLNNNNNRYRYNRHQYESNNEAQQRVNDRNDNGNTVDGLATCVVSSFVNSTNVFYHHVDRDDDEDDDDHENDDSRCKKGKNNIVSKKCRVGRIDLAKTVKNITNDDKDIIGNGKNSNSVKFPNNGDNGICLVTDGRRSRSSLVSTDMNECRGNNDAGDRHERERELEKVKRFVRDKSNEVDTDIDKNVVGKIDGIGDVDDEMDIDDDDGGNSNSSSSNSGSMFGNSNGSSDDAAAVAVASATAVSPSIRDGDCGDDDDGSGSGGAPGVTANGLVAGRHQGSPFKGQVRTAEDTLVGPCGKKRCADRYDSSESSDSGVAVSCGECSSSGTSDITEPGSPCSTSSDEGVAIRGASASPLPSLPKLAPSSQISTRPQWPWTPPLAATACSTYKRLKGEPEAGALPRSGAADPSFRGTTKSTAGKGGGGSNGGIVGGGQQQQHQHHEQQGKITEYFKTQIKPQQAKIKKTSENMSAVLVAKSTTEFRRPATVQRNKGGLSKYLGTVSSNGRAASNNDWEVRGLTMSPPPSTKKSPPVIVPRTNGKMEKKLPKTMPSLPISNDVLKTIPSCKISSIRLATESSPNGKNVSPPSTPAPTLVTEATSLDFKGCILAAKPHVNENNNLTNGCGTILGSLRSQTGQQQDPLSRLTVPEDNGRETKVPQVSPVDEDYVEEEEEDSSRSSESKPPLSPILSAPTTIRFPAREPEKDRQQSATDSGVCRWDKCEESFESSGELLEHLQTAHINTQTGGDNFVCQWRGCKVQGRSSCSRRWLERHVLSHGGNKPFRCIVDNCGSRFSSQTALERHVNGHFNQPETSNSNGRRSCESGGKLVRRNGKRLRYRRQPWSARLFDYFDSGVMEGLQHRLLQLAKARTQGRLAETPGNSMVLTSQVLARRVELDGKTKVLLRWYPPDIEPDEWVLETEVQSTKNVRIRKIASSHPEEVTLALCSAVNGDIASSGLLRAKQRRKPVKNS